MDRKWTIPAALAAAVWTVLLLSPPEVGLYFPGGVEYVWRSAAPSPAPTLGTSPAPDPTPMNDVPSPYPTAIPTQAPGDEPTPGPAAASSHVPETDGPEIRSFTDSSAARLRNFTSFDPEAEGIAQAPLSQRLPSEGPQILIIHTHGTEAYLPVPGEEYEASDPYRTTDGAHSVIRVGDVLCAALEAQGLSVLHDRGLYDYPSYTGSYARCQAAVETWLAEYPGIGIVIDLHRDAVGSDRVIYKTLAATEGESAAQVMLVVGTGENGLDHPRWRQNLALALALQRALDAEGRALARPIRLVRERYNQHLSSGAFILEVGTNGNTLSEAERAAELFARAAGPLFLSLVKDD